MGTVNRVPGTLTRPALGWARRRGAAWLEPTTPAALRRLAALLAAGAVLAAVVSASGAAARVSAVDQVEQRLAVLNVATTDLYQALAEADAQATTGFLTAGREPPEVRAAYDASIEQAARELADAGRLASPDAADAVAVIATQLPAYTGLVEAARTYNRSGLPLGLSYLTDASSLMQTTILPAAADLRGQVQAEIDRAYRQATRRPLPVVVVGLGLLAVLADVSRQERRRTNRVLNSGLVVAAAAVLAATGWWLAAWWSVGSALDDARSHADAVISIDDARVAALQARSEENLALVARSGGSGSTTFDSRIEQIGDADGGFLAEAARVGVDVAPAADAVGGWVDAHRQLVAADRSGAYGDAVESATGTGLDQSGGAFSRVERTLTSLAATEQDALAAANGRGAGRQRLLVPGPAVLLVAGAGAALVGLQRRLAEYR